MAIEAMRGCGYRKIGGLYLCGGGAGMDCDRLPFELEVCPVCGSGIKFTRGWTWIDWLKYAGDHTIELPSFGTIPSSVVSCRDMVVCPVCSPSKQPQPYGLLWVGEASYTPQTFIQEALTMGVSRRIAAVPKNLKLGETWILFAHKKAFEGVSVTGRQDKDFVEEDWRPGVFYAFKPQSLELLIWESDAKPEYLEDLAKRNITPVIIPDGDEDHHPDTKTKMSAGDRAGVDIHNKITLLRKRIGR